MNTPTGTSFGANATDVSSAVTTRSRSRVARTLIPSEAAVSEPNENPSSAE